MLRQLACCSLIAAWLLALGIDLFVNTGSGAAYGLRILLDRQSSHRASLDVPGYQPPLSTQLIFGLSVCVVLSQSETNNTNFQSNII